MLSRMLDFLMSKAKIVGTSSPPKATWWVCDAGHVRRRWGTMDVHPHLLGPNGRLQVLGCTHSVPESGDPRRMHLSRMCQAKARPASPEEVAAHDLGGAEAVLAIWAAQRLSGPGCPDPGCGG